MWKAVMKASSLRKCLIQTAQNQQEYQQRYDALVDYYETAKSKFELLEKEIAERHTKVQAMEEFIANISK